MGLEKAIINVEKGDGSVETVKVLFNPNHYSLESSNAYALKRIPGLSSPISQFISGEAATLSMDLFFDTSEAREDVRNYTSKISGLLSVDKDLHAPPLCSFIWGSLNFRGYLLKVTQKFTMFLDSGIPVRATLSVTLREFQSMTEQFQNTPRQSSDRTKQRVLKQNEQLCMIAAQAYDDPGLWRDIARANNIDNPLDLEAGKHLVIPPLES
ncbi:MAG: peptidoglycan-binding protein [Syntrophomonas sp.]